MIKWIPLDVLENLAVIILGIWKKNNQKNSSVLLTTISKNIWCTSDNICHHTLATIWCLTAKSFCSWTICWFSQNETHCHKMMWTLKWWCAAQTHSSHHCAMTAWASAASVGWFQNSWSTGSRSTLRWAFPPWEQTAAPVCHPHGAEFYLHPPLLFALSCTYEHW